MQRKLLVLFLFFCSFAQVHASQDQDAMPRYGLTPLKIRFLMNR